MAQQLLAASSVATTCATRVDPFRVFPFRLVGFGCAVSEALRHSAIRHTTPNQVVDIFYGSSLVYMCGHVIYRGACALYCGEDWMHTMLDTFLFESLASFFIPVLVCFGVRRTTRNILANMKGLPSIAVRWGPSFAALGALAIITWPLDAVVDFILGTNSKLTCNSIPVSAKLPPHPVSCCPAECPTLDSVHCPAPCLVSCAAPSLSFRAVPTPGRTAMTIRIPCEDMTKLVSAATASSSCDPNCCGKNKAHAKPEVSTQSACQDRSTVGKECSHQCSTRYPETRPMSYNSAEHYQDTNYLRRSANLVGQQQQNANYLVQDVNPTDHRQDLNHLGHRSSANSTEHSPDLNNSTHGTIPAQQYADPNYLGQGARRRHVMATSLVSPPPAREIEDEEDSPPSAETRKPTNITINVYSARPRSSCDPIPPCLPPTHCDKDGHITCDTSHCSISDNIHDLIRSSTDYIKKYGDQCVCQSACDNVRDQTNSSDKGEHSVDIHVDKMRSSCNSSNTRTCSAKAPSVQS